MNLTDIHLTLITEQTKHGQFLFEWYLCEKYNAKCTMQNIANLECYIASVQNSDDRGRKGFSAF